MVVADPLVTALTMTICSSPVGEMLRWEAVDQQGDRPSGREQPTMKYGLCSVLSWTQTPQPASGKGCRPSIPILVSHFHVSFSLIPIPVSPSFPCQFQSHSHTSFTVISSPIPIPASLSFPYQYQYQSQTLKLKCWRLTQKHESHISCVQCHWRGAIHVWRCWAGGCLHMCWGTVQFPHWYIHIAACLIPSAIYVALWDFTSIVHFTLRAHRFPYMVEARDVWDPP